MKLLRLFAFAGLAFVSCVSLGAGTALEWVYGEPEAPPLILKNHDGGEFDLTTLRGKVVLINFWATWCPPCRAEMPAIARLKDRFKDRPFEVVAVHVGPGAEEIDEFRSQSEPALDFPIVIDETGETAREWKLKGLPLTWIVNSDGGTSYTATGDREWDHDDIAKIVEKLLTKSN